MKSSEKITKGLIGKKEKLYLSKKSNGANSLIWRKGGPWEIMARKHFDKPVRSWRHTENVMVITLEF